MQSHRLPRDAKHLALAVWTNHKIARVITLCAVIGAASLAEAQAPPASPFSREAAAAQGASATARRPAERFAFVIYHAQRLKLLRDPAVQQLLGLTPTQLQEINAMGNALDGAIAGARGLDFSEVDQTIARYEGTAESFGARLDAMLTTEQDAALLKRVASQQRSSLVFLLPGVVKALNYTDEQKQQIEAIVSGDLNTVRNARIAQLLQIRQQLQASRARAEAVLTPTQLQQWRELAGGTVPATPRRRRGLLRR